MDNNLKAKLVQLNIIVNVAHKYFNALSRYLIGTDANEHGRVTTALERADKLLETLPGAFGQIHVIRPTDIDKINGVYLQITELENLVNDFTIMCESKTYARMLAQELSTGKHADMQLDLAKMRTAREVYAGIGDTPMIDAIGEMTAESARGFHKYIVDHKSQPTKLILEICRKLLTALSGKQRADIVAFVRRQQMEILGAQVISNKCEGHTGTIYRCGLMPVTKLVSLSELFGILKWEYSADITPDDNFQEASQRKRILILDNSSPTVVQFDFTGVLDLSKVTKIPEYSGLNKSYISRYNVLEQFDTTRKMPAEKTIYAVMNDYRNHPDDTWIVIERIGDLYRVLARDGVIEIPSRAIMSMLEGVPDTDTRYNTILAEHSMRINRDDMFDPRAKIFIDNFRTAQVVKTASGPIKSKIVERLIARASTLIAHVHSAAEFTQMFAIPAFTTVVNTVCADVLGVENKLLKRFDTPEYLVSHLSKITGITDKFAKAIKRFAGEERVQDRIFSEYTAEKVIQELTERTSVVLNKAANHLDNDSTWVSGELSLKEFVITGIF